MHGESVNRRACRCLVASALLLMSAAPHAQNPTSSLPGEVAKPAAPASPAVPKTGDPNKGTGVIRGHILLADGRPARKASIQLTFDGPPRATAADEDGTYEFTELAAAAYTMTAGRPGYLVMEYGQKRAFERGEPIQLADGETRTKVDITLQPNGAVSGRVLDEYGDPIENVTVRLLQLHYFGGHREAVDVALAGGQTTDDTGAYRIYGVPPGDYVVRASVTDRIVNSSQNGDGPAVRPLADLPGYAPTYFPGGVSPATAQVVRVGLAQDVLGIDFTLNVAATARVSGTAVDSQGRAVRVFMARTERSNGFAEAPVLSTPSSDGGFEFDNVAPGEYVLQTALGQRRGGDSGEADFAMTYLDVEGRNVAGIHLAGTSGSSVNGTVVFEGLEPDAKPPAVTITAWPVDTDHSPMLPTDIASTRTGNDRRFTLAGLHGPRRIRVARASQGWTLKAVRVSGQDVTDDILPFGASPQSLNNVQVVMSKGATITGGALDDTGRPARDYVVAACSTDADRWYPRSRFLGTGFAKKDGSFSIPGLAPGDYYVVATSSLVSGEGWSEVQDPEFLSRFSTGAERVTLADGQTASVSLGVINR
jgi:hypothetical protein